MDLYEGDFDQDDLLIDVTNRLLLKWNATEGPYGPPHGWEITNATDLNNVQDNRLVARRGDLLAALCQETVGDHSWVTRSNLQCALDEFDKELSIWEKLYHQHRD